MCKYFYEKVMFEQLLLTQMYCYTEQDSQHISHSVSIANGEGTLSNLAMTSSPGANPVTLTDVSNHSLQSVVTWWQETWIYECSCSSLYYYYYCYGKLYTKFTIFKCNHHHYLFSEFFIILNPLNNKSPFPLASVPGNHYFILPL